MEIKDYFRNKRYFYDLFISILDKDNEEDFEIFKDYLLRHNIMDNYHEFKLFLHLLSTISNYHHRKKGFSDKITQILEFIQDPMKQYFVKNELFELFDKNKQILLFLLKKGIITIQDIITKVKSNDDLCFFYPEIKNSGETEKIKLIEKVISKIDKDAIENFEKYRYIGENHTYLCSLIRDDLIKEFVFYLSQNDVNLSKLTIKRSIFETNLFLNEKKSVTLMEYACFYGSVKIYQYLKSKFFAPTQSLMIFAIHSRSRSMIHLLEEEILFDKSDLSDCYVESIKCHHNEIAEYLVNNGKASNVIYVDTEYLFFENYNFNFITDRLIDYLSDYLFYKFCRYDYSAIVQIMINQKVSFDNYQVKEYNFENNDILQIFFDNHMIDIEYFMSCQKLFKLKIPSFVTEIRNSSFDGCNCLEKITIPSSVTRIGKNAFYGCSDLKEITIPSSVNYIGENAFNGCSNLKEIKILSSLITRIYKSTFSGCISLKEIKIPSSVTLIDPSAFNQCETLTQIILPHSITRIEEDTFKNCKSLAEIKMPSTVTYIAKGAFQGCKMLKEIKIPSSSTKIEDFTFCGCSSLSEIKIPSGVTEIGEKAFYRCSLLKEIILPSSLICIGFKSFGKCALLKQIMIPSSVDLIGEGAFKCCSSLSEIEISSSMTLLDKSIFEECSSLKKINIPSSVTSIEESAFKKCISLTHLAIPPSLISIGKDAFKECSSLIEISIPSTVTSIESEAFSGCSSLQKIRIPSSIHAIKKATFFNCNSLKEIIIPLSVKTIEKCAFWGCYQLDTKIIPSTVTYFRYAFDGCFKLSEIMDKPIQFQKKEDIPSINDYDIQEILSYKHYSNVCKAIDKRTGKEVVLKFSMDTPSDDKNIFFSYAITNSEIPGIVKINNFRFPSKDSRIIRIDQSKNIINTKGYIIIKDFMKNGNLRDRNTEYLSTKGLNNERMNPTIRSKIIFGIAAIMKKVLKIKDICHHQLNISNILLDDNFEPLLNILDFSSLKEPPPKTDDDHDDYDMIDYDADIIDHRHDDPDDIYFVSPEEHEGDITDKSVVYSYGIILYMMFNESLNMTINGRTLTRLKTRYLIAKTIVNGGRYQQPNNIPEHYWKLINECWKEDPDKRPSFEEITNILRNDLYAIDEYGMKTNLDELHEYQNRIDHL